MNDQRTPREWAAALQDWLQHSDTSALVAAGVLVNQGMQDAQVIEALVTKVAAESRKACLREIHERGPAQRDGSIWHEIYT